MKRKFKKIILMLSVVITMTAYFAFKTEALDLSYSGNSTSNNTGASATTSGFTISYDAAKDNICGYRFSIVSSNGLTKSVTRVINVYITELGIGDTAYFSGQRFISSNNVVANKKELANGIKVTSSTTTQGCDCYSSAMGFYYAIPQDPSSIGDWIKSSYNGYQNLQRIYYYCNSNLADASASDYILIEPIFWVKLAGVRTAATATELAIYGVAVSGGDQYKGTDGNLYNAGSGTLWNLSNYINREFPNTLYVSSDTDVYPAVSVNSSSKYIYKEIIHNGYGCSILTVKNVIPIKKVYMAYHPNGGTTSTALNGYGWIIYDGTVYFHTINNGQTDDPYNASTFGLTRAGYTFGGWKVYSTGQILEQDTQYASTVYAQFDDASKTTANTNEVTCYLYAVWIPNKVEVLYYPNGGSVTTETNYWGWVMMNGVTAFHTINYGESDDTYNASTFGLTRPGYTFVGWEVYSTGQILEQDTQYASTVYAQYDNASITTANTNKVTCYLYAVWEVNKVSLAYHPNGGTTNTALNQYGWVMLDGAVYFHSLNYGESDDTYNASTFGLTRPGYTFIGWRVGSTGQILNQDNLYDSTVYADNRDANITTANTKEVTCYLYAVWEKTIYTNEIGHWAWGFNGNGNNTDKNGFRLATTSFTKEYGDTYAFDKSYSCSIPNGFFLNEVYSTSQIAGKWTAYPFSTQVNQQDRSLYVQFDYYPYSYNITYDLNGGTNNSENPDKYNVLYGVTLNNPSKENSDFLGWDLRVTQNINMTVSQNDWNYDIVLYNLKPGVDYNISIESAKLISGTASMFSCYIYDFTARTVLDDINVLFGNDINFSLTVPTTADASHDMCLIVYSGIAGSTKNNSIEYKNVSVQFEEDGINKGCGSAFASSDELFENLQRRIIGDVEFIAKWENINEEEIIIVPIEPNADYRENTDVISSFWLVNPSDNNYTSLSRAKVVFSVYNHTGQKLTEEIQNFVCPENEKNLVYFKWFVPNGYAEQNIDVKAHITDGTKEYSHTNNTYTVIAFDTYTTPDTRYIEKAPAGFSVPEYTTDNIESARWWQWEYVDGEFIKKEFAVANDLSNITLSTPNAPSAYTEDDKTYMKSGYGFECNFTLDITAVDGYDTNSASACTVPQYCYALFPEYNYSYGLNSCRSFETELSTKAFTNTLDIQRQHFIPIYYPDGEYVFKIVLSDCWTPAGMIKTDKNSIIYICGNIYEDWYIRR